MTTANEWISVEERLPPEAEEVLVTWRGESGFAIAVFREKWREATSDYEIVEPTHWMPLPEGPAP